MLNKRNSFLFIVLLLSVIDKQRIRPYRCNIQRCNFLNKSDRIRRLHIALGSEVRDYVCESTGRPLYIILGMFPKRINSNVDSHVSTVYAYVVFFFSHSVFPRLGFSLYLQGYLVHYYIYYYLRNNNIYIEVSKVRQNLNGLTDS